MIFCYSQKIMYVYQLSKICKIENQDQRENYLDQALSQSIRFFQNLTSLDL